MPDGTYRLETNKPKGSPKNQLLLDRANYMDTVSAPGKVVTLCVGDEGRVKEFERYPWHEERAEAEEETSEIIEGKLVKGVDTIR